MSNTLFSERVNEVSSLISSMTIDPAERLGIASALLEIYKYEIAKSFTYVENPEVRNGN